MVVKNVFSTFATVGTCTRNDVLAWVKAVLKCEIKNVQELCSGVEYCLMMNMLFPACIPLQKVKMNASLEREYLHNWKILQATFEKLKIKNNIPTEKLVLGKFHDNFDFAQWFKKFFEANYNACRYQPAVEIRRAATPPTKTNSSPTRLEYKDLSKTVSLMEPPSTSSQAGKVSRAKSQTASSSRASSSSWPPKNTQLSPRTVSHPVKSPRKTVAPSPVFTPITVPTEECACQTSSTDVQLKPDRSGDECRKIEDLSHQNKDLRQINHVLTKEREFYFGKLRKIEVVCQENEEMPVIKNILAVLYAVEEGFAPCDE